MVKVAEGGKEGTLLKLCLMEVLLLEHLVKFPLDLCLLEVCTLLALALIRVVVTLAGL